MKKSAVFNDLSVLKVILTIFCALFLISSPSIAQNDSTSNGGFISFNGYYDSREMSVFTVNTLAFLPKKFEYFSTLNVFNDLKNSEKNTYIENHLNWTVKKNTSLDLNVYWVHLSGPVSDALKLGLRWRVSNAKFWSKWMKRHKLNYFLSVFVADLTQMRGQMMFNQAQHFYRWDLPSKKNNSRLYLSGFANQYMDWNSGNPKFSWVHEHQLGFRVYKNFYFVAEYRFNQFWQDQQGLGIGLEYFLKI